MTETANIGTPETLPIAQLNLHHQNPRLGDIEAIKTSMATNGIYKPIVVNRGTYTNRPYEVLAGNHSLKAMRELAEENPTDTRWQQVQAWVVDVDEERATKIVLADNRTADLGDYDNSTLLALLATVEHDLDGTGYTETDYDDLAALYEDATPLPEPETHTPATTQQPTADTPPQTNSTNNTPTPQETQTPTQQEQPLGVTESRGQSTTKHTYHEQPTRMIVLHLPLNQFVWAQQQLENWHNQHPEANGANATALLRLLENYSGETAPTNDETEQPE